MAVHLSRDVDERREPDQKGHGETSLLIRGFNQPRYSSFTLRAHQRDILAILSRSKEPPTKARLLVHEIGV